MSWLATWDPTHREQWEQDIRDRTRLLRCHETFRHWIFQVEWVWGPPKDDSESWRRLGPGSGR